MKTILFCATYPDQPIGYGRIANILSNILAANSNFKVYYFGFSNFKDKAVYRFIHPNITFVDVYKEEKELYNCDTENFGTNLIENAILKLKPDVVFIYNDILVTCRLFNVINATFEARKFKIFVYLDLVYKNEKSLYVNFVKQHADFLFVFSDYWKNHLVTDFGFQAEKVAVLYHGVGIKGITRVQSEREKQKRNVKVELGCDPGDFIILNTNRNTYRKMWDLTIESFLIFLKKQNMNPTIKLFVNCELSHKTGYDLLELIRIYSKKYDMNFDTIIFKHILQPKTPGKVTDDMMSTIYQASDLGLNTCCGEGFGLCNLEGGAMGTVQVVTNTTGLSDMFQSFANMTVAPWVEIQCPSILDDHNGTLEICRADDIASKIDYWYNNPVTKAEREQKLQEYLLEKYNWNTILKEFIEKMNMLVE